MGNVIKKLVVGLIVGAVLWVASMAIDKSDRCHTYHDYRYCDLDELPMPGLGK